MDDIEKRVLSQLRSRLIKEVVVTESFLCAFCDNNVMDDQMARLLKTETNYESRASKLLDMLPSRGSRAFLTLMEILEMTNPWLADKMRAALHDERNKDAKINLHPSVSQNASIEGVSQTLRLHIDTDIKERATRFIKTNLHHMSDIEQRGVEKWLADELQRERRRQQFRAPHNMPRNHGDFHASKEVQTDTSNMDLVELYEEMSIYLHGVDYVQMTVDFSFKKLSQKVTELLTRTRKLDALFLNCLDKFDDPDKYAIPLPDLIDRMLSKERSQSHINNADKKLVQKLSEERDLAKRQVKRLEDELDKALQRQSPTQKPQEIQLRNRQNINVRYSLLIPDHAHHSDMTQPGVGPFTVTTLNPANSVDSGSHPHQSSSQPDSHKNSGPPLVTYAMGSQVVAPDPRLVVKNKDNDGRPSDASGMANTSVDAKKTSSHYSMNPKDNKSNFVLHSASSFHAALPQGKLRRHASEESLKVAISKEEAETSSLTYLNHAMNQGQRTNQNATVEVDHPQQNNLQKQPPSTRVDVQNKMLRMLTSASRTNQKVRRSESERAVGSHGPRVDRPWKNAEADSVFKGNTSLRASYENIVSAVKKGEQLLDGSNPPTNNTNSIQYQHNEEPPHNPYRIIFQQPAAHKPPGHQAGSHQSRQEHYQLQKQRQASSLVYEDPAQEQSLHTRQAGTTQKTTLIYPRDASLLQSKAEEWQPAVGHPRTSSRDRDHSLKSHATSFLPRPPSRGNPSAGLDYTSDSELVINSGTRTASPGRTKARVRFASPVSRTSKPTKKTHGRGILASYQNDTASATNKKIKKRI